MMMMMMNDDRDCGLDGQSMMMMMMMTMMMMTMMTLTDIAKSENHPPFAGCLSCACHDDGATPAAHASLCVGIQGTSDKRKGVGGL